MIRDRREGDRFPCRLVAVLVVGEREFSVECDEISEQGARITSMRPLPVALRREVLLKVRIGDVTFQDRYVVVRIAPNRNGPISVELGLQTSAPAGLTDG